MVTAAQLQILQSPITKLISTISTSVNVKLDDTNYLNWHFQMHLLLESNGIIGFVDGTHLCPSTVTVDECGTHNSPSSSSSVECDDVLIWKLHDRAVMQLITATLSPIAMSCAIGSVSSRDLWTRLVEQFSTVSKTSIFQMKSNLQNIRKGADSASQYLLKIKEARDYLTAAGVHYSDEDIVILALNGLSSEYNTFRCVIRGRESVITLREFRSQLLAEEKIVESIVTEPSYMSAMHTVSAAKTGLPSVVHQLDRSQSFQPYDNTAYRPFNRGRGKGKFHQGMKNFNQRPQFFAKPPMHQNSSRPVCQLCNREGHIAPTCEFRRDDRSKCSICGRTNHTTWYCFHNDSGPNFSGSTLYSPPQASQPSSSHAMQAMNTVLYPNQYIGSANFSSAQSQSTPVHTMQPMHSTQSSPQMWLADSGATNHMTSDLSNLSLAAPYPSTDAVQTANGEGQGHREDNLQRVL